MGVAVQSHAFSVWVVAWAEAGVGAVATQARTNIDNGPLGLELLRRGKGAADTLKALVALDNGAAERQVAILDGLGNAAAHTGEKCIPEAGHIVN